MERAPLKTKTDWAAQKAGPVAFSSPAAAVFLLLVLLAVLLQSRVFNQMIYLGDEGVAAMDGLRIAQGQVPNRDFLKSSPPFLFF